MTTSSSPPELIQQLWDELARHRKAGNRLMAERTARTLEKQLRSLPDHAPGSAVRPGIVGMLRFAVVCAELGRTEEAIEWRTQRLQLLREFLEKDPENSLGLYSLDDLHNEFVELARLYEQNGQVEKAKAILAEWQREELAHGKKF